MNEIGIVTAFFDIGRGEWTPDKGLPHYLHRTNDTYLHRFRHMAQLENPMVVYTSKQFVKDVKLYRAERPTEVVIVDFEKNFTQLREDITKVQKSEEYLSKINPMQVRNPEYWSADYVLVNLLKSTFVNQSLNHLKTDLVAWLDFGYCRDESTLNGVKKWCYPFAKDKIHFFNIKDWVEGTLIQDVIANNDVHVTGPCIVGGRDMWYKLEHLVYTHTMKLLENNLIDDDQTLLLMSYLSNPDIFELHNVSNQDWFVAFKEYHDNTLS
jgi:protein YibB